MIIYIKKRNVYIILILLIVICTSFLTHKYVNRQYRVGLIVGGKLQIEKLEEGHEKNIADRELDYEKYFRPSNMPVLNTNEKVKELLSNIDKKSETEVVPSKYFKSPEDTIVNYFSLLREASNPVEGKIVGCGSLGVGKIPYKIAYNFFTKAYQKKVKFKDYEKSFSNILHINLIKYKEVPNNRDSLIYFYEIETIQGSESGVASFIYYYGFVTLTKEGNEYKISDITITPENYLCAPYHGWIYDGMAKVEIEYGDWCKLVKSIDRVEENGYVKNIFFEGTDNREYKIEFYTLTNDYDIEVAQYVKDSRRDWKNIKLNPNECLKK